MRTTEQNLGKLKFWNIMGINGRTCVSLRSDISLNSANVQGNCEYHGQYSNHLYLLIFPNLKWVLHEGKMLFSFFICRLISLSFFTLQTNARLHWNQRENCIRNHSKKMVRTLKRKELIDSMIEYRRGMITRRGRERQI